MSTAAGPEEEPGQEAPAGEGTTELDEDVLEMVRRQLDRDPPPSTTALYGRAARINRDIYDLSLRQFHAKYPLRVKREQARRERQASAGSSGPASSGDGDADGDSGGAGSRARDGAGSPDAEVGDDAGRRHLFGSDAGRGGGDEERLRSGGSDAGGGSAGSSPDASVAEGRAGDVRGRRAGPSADEGTRQRVRRVFMRFAREVAEADRPGMLVGVAERLPDRVDEIARIVRARPPEA